jgi:putrescine transport system substrate-binding protein
LNWLKLNPNSKNQNDLRRAADVLGTMKRSVKKFHSSEYINGLTNGDICLAVGWAGDSFQARNRAREAGNGIEINYVIPKEGTLISLDSLAIPKDAAHVDEAYKLIDFLMRPEIAARNTSVTNFANGIIASKPFVDKTVLENKAVYPDEAMMKRFFTTTSNDLPTQKFITREWTRVKTGK